MKTFLTVLLFGLILSLPNIANAQGENNVWAFGDSIGLDFNG